VGFAVDKVALGQAISEYFGFPCQSSFHQFLHNHHHLSSGAGTIGQWWAQYQVDSVSPHKLGAYFKIHMAFRKADESPDCSGKILQFLQTCIITFKNKHNF
jgi:hypothetical protein